MINKYQISINYLKKFSDGYDEIGGSMYPYEYSERFKLCIDTLQELINAYEYQRKYIHQLEEELFGKRKKLRFAKKLMKESGWLDE